MIIASSGTAEGEFSASIWSRSLKAAASMLFFFPLDYKPDLEVMVIRKAVVVWGWTGTSLNSALPCSCAQRSCPTSALWRCREPFALFAGGLWRKQVREGIVWDKWILLSTKAQCQILQVHLGNHLSCFHASSHWFQFSALRPVFPDRLPGTVCVWCRG